MARSKIPGKERKKTFQPRAVPGGTKDPRNRCQRRGSSYTKWVKVGNPFWGWSTTSRLPLSPPLSRSLCGHHVLCLCPPYTDLYIPTPWNLAPCRWVLSGVNALAQCTYSNPNLDDLEGSFVRVWPGPGRDWLTEYRWWFVLLGLLFAGMDIGMIFTIEYFCFLFSFFSFCLFVSKRKDFLKSYFKLERFICTIYIFCWDRNYDK